jgi:hypothetical protein
MCRLTPPDDQFDIQNSLNLEMVDSTIILDLLSKTNISKAAGIDKLSMF